MAESQSSETPENLKDFRSLALTPTWSVASVLTVFVVVSLLVERSIHRLCHVSLFSTQSLCAFYLFKDIGIIMRK